MQAFLWETPTVRVLDYRCHGQVRGLGAEEVAEGYEVVLPRSGLFVRHVRGEAVVADANHAHFFNRGECYRVSHPVRGGDSCTSLGFAPRHVRAAVASLDPVAADVEARLFSRTHVPTSPAIDLVHRRLLRTALAGSDPTAMEEAALDVLGAVLEASAAAGEHPVRGRAAATERDHAQLVRAAKEELARRLGSKLRLEPLAAAVHASPFHLSRVFRARTGLSLSSYHRRLRLRAGLERILEGEEDLTRLALDLGFAHHSHFTSAFRREFGLTPSASRAPVGAGELRVAAARLASCSL